MNPFDCHGLWWAPDEPSKTVAGTLSFADDRGLVLSLMGVIGDRPVPFGEKSQPVILGKSYDSPEGSEITLLGCEQKGFTLGSSGIDRESYFVEKALLGAHLVEEQDYLFDSCTVDFSGLHPWTDYPGKVFEKGARGIGSSFLLEYDPPASLHVDLGEASIGLGWSFSYGGGRGEWSLNERVRFVLSSKEELTPESWHSRYVSPLQDFLTLATDFPNRLDKFVFDQGHLRKIQYVRPRIYSQAPEEGSLHPGRMLFTLDDVRDEFGDLIRRWLEVHKRFEAACNTYFSGVYSQHSYMESRLQPVVRALQIYEETRNGRGRSQFGSEMLPADILDEIPESPRARLVDWLSTRFVDTFDLTLAKLYDEHEAVMGPLTPQGKAAFLDEANRLRVHALYYKGDVTDVSDYSARMYLLLSTLSTLMKACLLREAGFSPDRCTQFFRRNATYGFLVHMARKSLRTGDKETQDPS